MIGIIEDPRGHPVKQDPLGTPAEVKTGPYLLDDGVSFEAPIPVVIVTGDFYRDSVGNLRGVWPMNITGLTAPPVNITPPAITGTPRVGQVLSGSNGTWTGTPTPAYTRQWLRNGTSIAGATSASYTLVAADAGAAISLRVTATNSAGNATSTSVTVGPVVQDVANVTPPAVTLSGNTLTTTNGTWTGVPAPTFTRIWQRSADGVSGWVHIAGQTGLTYDLTTDDIGQYVRSVVAASNSSGTLTILSNVFGPVAAATVWNWQTITLTAGTDGTQWFGYSDGGESRPAPAFGSISNQPSSVVSLLALYDDTNSDVYLAVFSGDWASEMSALPMSIGGTPFTPFESELISGNTWVRYNGVGDWIENASYEVEFG